MKSARILWLLIFSAAAILCFACADAGALLLLLSIILIPTTAALINMLHKPQITFELHFPKQCEKKEEACGTVEIKNGSLIGYRRVRNVLKLKNRLTQEKLEDSVSVFVGAKEKTSVDVCFKAKYCGMVEILLSEVRLYDFFGLTFKRIKPDVIGAVTVLPEVFPIEVKLTGSFGADNVEDYAADRSGNDLSEVYEFAEYKSGDSLHRIQWKLSQKHGNLIVRRGSMPIEKSVMLIMTHSFANPERASAVAEATVSLADSFCEAGISCKLMIKDGDEFSECEIENEDDLAAFLPKLLSVSPHGDLLDENTAMPSCTVCITDDEKKARYYNRLGACVFLADGKPSDGIICFSSKKPSEDLFETEL